MLRLLSSVIILAAAAVASAQDTGTTSDGLTDKTPFENNASGAVAGRAPGTIIQAALSKHTQANNDRLSRQRSGLTADSSSDNASQATSGDSSGSLSSTLSDLLGSGILGSLGSSLSGLTGSSSDSSSLPPEVLALLQQAGIDPNAAIAAANSSTARVVDNSKVESRSQTTTSQPSFRVRWTNAVLDTVFTSLVFAFQTPTFIDFLAQQLEPILFEPADTSTAKSVNPPPAVQPAAAADESEAASQDDAESSSEKPAIQRVHSLR